MAVSQRRAADERCRALVPFVGQYVSLVTRGTPGTDDEEARPGQLFIGLLSKFDATTIVLAGVVQIDLRTRKICSFSASGGGDASPVYLTAQFKQLARVARCASGTLHKLFRDPNRPCIPMQPSEAEDRAARRFLRAVLIRRYVFAEMRDAVQPPEPEEDDENGDTSGQQSRQADGGAGGVDEELEAAVSEAVGGAPPTSTDTVARIRMPLSGVISGHVQKMYRAQRDPRNNTNGDGDDEGENERDRGPPVAIDNSPFAAILRAVPQEIGKMRVCDVRQQVHDECLELRRLYAPRKISPATRLNAVVHAFVKACFLFTIVLSVLFCVLGGIMIGAAVSGPLTSGGLAGDFAGYMWYLLICPGVLSACHGVCLSARGEDAASPTSRIPKVWIALELCVVLLLAPGFVFSVMFLAHESTPRSEQPTAREFWESLASTSDERICAFQESERCSGFDSRCYIPGNATTVFIIQRADCAIQCRMSLSFLRDLPSATCGPKFTAPIEGVSSSTIAFLSIFVVMAFGRLVGLGLIRRHYSRRAIAIHAEMLQRFNDEHQAQQQQQQQQQQNQGQPEQQQQPQDEGAEPAGDDDERAPSGDAPPAGEAGGSDGAAAPY